MVSGGMEDGYATSTGMADQREAGGGNGAQLALHQGIDHSPQIVYFGGEGVVAESVGQRKFASVVDSAAAQIGADGSEAGSSQALGKGRKHPPVLEALEAVDDDPRGTRRTPSSGPNIHEDVSEGTGERVFGKTGRRHAEW